MGTTDKTLSFALATQTEICAALGEQLKTQRLSQLLSRAEVAGRAGVSEGTLRNLEVKGVATLESFVRIAQALGLSGHLESLFVLAAPRSIEQMEQAERSTRKRAPKRRVS
jgi:transcriptional regulator with XRE-family HTH domain